VSRLAGAALVVAVWWAVVAPDGAAQQVSGSVDVSVSRVEYDEFLPSGAASISPAIRVTSDQAFFTARGTWLGFESGNSSFQAVTSGSAFTGALGHWRAEFSGSGGGSVYAGTVGFAHLLGRARLHYLGTSGGFWVAGTMGRAILSDNARQVMALTTGVWTGKPTHSLGIAAGTTSVGDTSYTDIEGTAFLRSGRVELQGSLGARGGRGGGRGVYGEANLLLSLTSHIGLTVAGGRYPTDPARGSIAGRYVSIGLRWADAPPPQRPRPEPAWTQLPISAASATATNGHLADITIEVEPHPGALHGGTLTVAAPGARLVEIMGDFTDWQPVVLTQVHGRWRYGGVVPPGLRRFNVRIDGGTWSVPAGATIVRDDFDEVVGLIVVP
jgi:hypothetical protein